MHKHLLSGVQAATTLTEKGRYGLVAMTPRTDRTGGPPEERTGCGAWWLDHQTRKHGTDTVPVVHQSIEQLVQYLLEGTGTGTVLPIGMSTHR